MSLVGSLEDLGLGDILQIISLSRKSGVLFLRSAEGDGRIVFQHGQVRGALVKGGPADLRGLLVGSGVLSEADYERVSAGARAAGLPAESQLATLPGLSEERIEELRRDATERAVLAMFLWPTGEFNFEVREDGDADREAGILLHTGLPAQFLAMEGTRLRDEAGRGGAPATAVSDDDDGFTLSGEDAAAEPAPVPAAPATTPAATAADALVQATVGEVLASDEVAEDADEVHDAELDEAEGELVESVVEGVAVEAPPLGLAAATPIGVEAVRDAAAAPPSGEAALPAGPLPPVVVVESDLAVLEWIKSALQGAFPRVHGFQRPDLGVGRIRQYLARVERPLVLLSESTGADPLTGARTLAELVERLRGQSPKLTIAILGESPHEGAAAPARPAGADAFLTRPVARRLADPRAEAERQRAGEALRDALLAVASRSATPPRVARESGADPAALRRLHEASARLRGAGSRGEVLPLVLRFAAEHFARVAMFMVRDDEALGMAQLGLERAGGPDDAALRRLRLPAAAPAWFRGVLERRSPLRGAPSDEGDRALARRLGTKPPAEAYVAPIESGDRVVALLYGDNLPGDSPLGDTAALEVVIHEAGLALDRAVLERTLAEAEQDAPQG